MIKLLVPALLMLIGAGAQADTSATCTTISRNPQPILGLSASGLPSRRLTSDVSYTNGTEIRNYQNFEVAQYKFTDRDFFIIIDDFSGNKLIEATAVGRASQMWGVLTERDYSGAMIRKVAIRCKITSN